MAYLNALLPLSQNPLYAQILQDIYLKKTQSFLEFSFESFYFAPFIPSLEKVFWNIANDELNTIKTLGTAITQLGEKPKFCTSKNCFLNTKNLNYQTSIKHILCHHINQKESNKLNIKIILNKISSPGIKKILQETQKIEECHLKILKNLDMTIKNAANYLQT
jgi:hypothetical protein